MSQSTATEVTQLASNQILFFSWCCCCVNVVLLHESLMIFACRNEMCDHESDDENKEQETTYNKPPSDGVSRLRAGQFSNNLHATWIIKVVSILYTHYNSVNHIPSKGRPWMLCSMGGVGQARLHSATWLCNAQWNRLILCAEALIECFSCSFWEQFAALKLKHACTLVCCCNW